MSEEDSEAEKPFAVERAKTGRAKCKKCKCPIEKDTVRIAKLVSNPFSDGKMKAWHHLSCLFEVFAKQRATTKRIDDPEEDISGWQNLPNEDKQIILQKVEEFESSSPFKNLKPKTAAANESSSSKKRKDPPTEKLDVSSEKKAKKGKNDSTLRDEGKSKRDDAFEEFRRLCEQVAKVDAYTDKTAIVRKMLSKGTGGDGFKSDVKLWCRMLLPGAVKRIYNLQSKQLVKLFSRMLLQDEDEMLEHLEQGDVAETIRVFFENSVAFRPAGKSSLTVQEVDQFLQQLSLLTKEDEQMHHFRSIISRCTADDLKMIIRLIKHDLRINAGPKHILAAIHDNAYEAFQTSRDLDSVLDRCLKGSSKFGESQSSGSSDVKVTLSLMTPVLPMLAEPCKSVEMAMKKCPNGMLAEVKYDGERVQLHKEGSEFRYFSRSLKPVLSHKVNLFKNYIPRAFPDGDDMILDSEVLMIDTKTGQPLPFGTLGVHKKAEFKDANVCLFVFDCIYYNGEVLLHKTMMERRQILKDRMTEIPNRIMLSEVKRIHNPQDLAEMIVKVLKLGLEGLVLKDVHSKYEPGKRHWLKIKKDYLNDGAMADSADLVVLGAWYGTGNKGGMMSVFLMGCYDQDRDTWVTVTKVHTGHDDATLAQLQDELEMVKIGKDPSKVPAWLRANKPMIPDFVAKDPKKQPIWEITGAEFTNHGVHTADGISIRFPRVSRIRYDKDWSTATTLNELRNLFKQKYDSIDVSLLLPSGSEIKKETESSESDAKRKSKSPSKRNDTSKASKLRSPKNLNAKLEENSEDASPSFGEKIKVEKVDISEQEDEAQVEFDASLNKEIDVERKSKSPTKKSKESKASRKNARVKLEDSKDASPGSSKKIKEEKVDTPNRDDEKRAEYYAFVDKHYTEYSAAGSPLNWIEGRKPPRGLPPDARSLSELSSSELASKGILKGASIALAPGFTDVQRESVRRSIKTLGAKALKDRKRSLADYVIHPCTEIKSTAVHELEDVPKSARHVSVSWLEATARSDEIQPVEEHAIRIVADYCSCPCPHH